MCSYSYFKELSYSSKDFSATSGHFLNTQASSTVKTTAHISGTTI